MSLPKYKLQELLQKWPNGTVATSAWLERIGVYKQLCFRYCESGWMESVARGAFKKYGDTLTWHGAVFALQTQLGIPVHPGALTALSLQGFAHYLKFAGEKINLFGPLKTNLPAWFKVYSKKENIDFYNTNFLPEGVGLTKFEEKDFSIKISSSERAILECLYIAPEELDLVECYQVMEGLVNLRPKLLQSLLEKCTSIKVKRLFLYMAEKANHQWLKYLDTKLFKLGSGDRNIVSGGVYIPKHRITVPKELKDL